jgi:HD superfamily phosphohydrolase YqeK
MYNTYLNSNFNNNTDLKIAALLHDIGKGFCKNFKDGSKYANFYGHENVSAQLAIIYLLKCGFDHESILKIAMYIRLHMHILKIEDVEIIDAVRYHTTAKAEMSLLCKILYLADFTSIDRDYDDVSVIRKLVDESLEDALVYALQYSITDLVNNKKAVHSDTLNAYNYTVGGK